LLKEKSLKKIYNPKIDGPIKNFIFDLETIKDVEVLSEIMSREGKQGLHWHGYLYEWEDTWSGFTMTGNTTQPGKARKRNYIEKAIGGKDQFYKGKHEYLKLENLNILEELYLSLGHINAMDFLEEVKTSGVSIKGLMTHHLISQGLIKIDSKGKWEVKNYNECFKAISRRFTFHLKKLTFSKNILKRLEIDRSKLQTKEKGVGLNKEFGSKGRVGPDNILPSLITLVSLGPDVVMIAESLKVLGFSISPKNVRQILKDNFGGLKYAKG